MDNIDFENDWKMITVQIGGNDQCKSCLNPDVYTPDNYEHYLNTAIRRIQHSVPKVIVNIIDQFNISEAYKAVGKNDRCNGPGADPVYNSCPCARTLENLDRMSFLGKGMLTPFQSFILFIHLLDRV